MALGALGILGALARPVLLKPFRRLGADPLARFGFRFEIADVLRQHIRARQAHIPSASVLELDRFECRIGGGIAHGNIMSAVSESRYRKDVIAAGVGRTQSGRWMMSGSPREALIAIPVDMD